MLYQPQELTDEFLSKCCGEGVVPVLAAVHSTDSADTSDAVDPREEPVTVHAEQYAISDELMLTLTSSKRKKTLKNCNNPYSCLISFRQ